MCHCVRDVIECRAADFGNAYAPLPIIREIIIVGDLSGCFLTRCKRVIIEGRIGKLGGSDDLQKRDLKSGRIRC